MLLIHFHKLPLLNPRTTMHSYSFITIDISSQIESIDKTFNTRITSAIDNHNFQQQQSHKVEHTKAILQQFPSKNIHFNHITLITIVLYFTIASILANHPNIVHSQSKTQVQ